MWVEMYLRILNSNVCYNAFISFMDREIEREIRIVLKYNMRRTAAVVANKRHYRKCNIYSVETYSVYFLCHLVEMCVEMYLRILNNNVCYDAFISFMDREREGD